MGNVSTVKQAGGFAGVIYALIAALVGFGVVSWSETEIAVVVVEVTGGVAVVAAVRGHLRSGTSAEPVALYGAVVAFASSTVGVLLVFEVVTDAQGGLLGALVATVAALVGVPVVRGQVTPASNLQRYNHVEPADAFYGEHGR